MPEQTTIRIYDNEFSVPAPYAEGHTLTAIEAKVLNRCLAENIANNMRKTVKDAIDAGGVDADTVAAFNEYAAAYEFTEAAAGKSRSAMSPVEREAKKIATAKVNKHLRDTGRTKKDVKPEAYEAEVARVAASDGVLKMAKRRVKENEEDLGIEVGAELAAA